MKKIILITCCFSTLSKVMFAQQSTQVKKTNSSDSISKTPPAVQAKGWDGHVQAGGDGPTPKPGTLNPGQPTVPPVAVPTGNGESAAGNTGVGNNANAASLNTIKCSPNRILTGYAALFTELNSLAVCKSSACTGESIVQTKTRMLLDNGSGGVFTFASNQNIPVAQQNEVITAATNWAIANTPAGFTLSVIKYVPDIVVPSEGPGGSAIDLAVTYLKCTGVRQTHN